MSISVFAQYQITIDAAIFDAETKRPIPFAQIEFKDKQIKAISNLNGAFNLEYDENAMLNTNGVAFTAIGYKQEITNVNQFYKLLKNTNKVYLKPINNPVETLVITSIVEPSANYHGVVNNNGIPVEGARVQVKNSFNEIQTDSTGNFRIKADHGDLIQATALGAKPEQQVLTKNTQLQLNLESDSEILDEVHLKNEYETETLIDLGFNGKKSFDAVGYDVKTMTAKDIKPHYYNLKDLLNGKFAGVTVAGKPNDPNSIKVYVRTQGSINNVVPAIFDIDGNIYQTLREVDIQSIKSLTILKSLAATHKYGSLGRGGVVVIRTNTAAYLKSKQKKRFNIVQGNNYKEHLTSWNVHTNRSDISTALNEATSFDSAKQIHENHERNLSTSGIVYYLDAHSYFQKWDKNYADAILNDLVEHIDDNPKALKSIAFQFDAHQSYDAALNIYQRLVLLRPNDAQSYRDLALAYQTSGFYNEALVLYKQMLTNTIEAVDFSGLTSVISNEMSHLLKKHRSKVDFSNLPSDFLKADYKIDARIVFQWNDPYAEFAFQFVNPQKKYYNYSHTQLNDKKYMQNEIKKGYATKEFIIDNDVAGTWLLNLENLAKETNTLNPTYLKYTLYQNYGLPNETTTVKLINLEDLKQKVTLDRFMNENNTTN